MIVVRNVVMCVTAAVFLAGCGDPTGQLDLDRGMAKLREGDFRSAVRLLEKVVGKRPHSATAHCNLGIAYWKAERTKQAITAFNTAADLAHVDTEPLEFLANIFSDSGEWDKAREALKEAAVRSPVSSRILTAKGVVELRAGEVNKGYEFLMQALDVNPEYLPAIYNIAVFYRDKVKNRKYAEKYFQKYLDVSEKRVGLPAEAGEDFLSDQKRMDIAKKFLLSATKTEPKLVDPLIEAARAAIGADNPAEALVMLKELIKKKPDSADALWELAIVYDKHLEFPDKAAEVYAEFARKFPADNRIESISVTEVPKAKPPEPLKVIKPIEPEKEPPAEIAADNGKPATKPPEAQEKSGKNQELAQKAWADGLVCHNKRDLDGAISHYKQALSYDGSYINALYNLGLAYMDNKEYELSRDALVKTLELDADKVSARSILGKVYVFLHDNKKAVEQLNRALRAEPDHAQANYYLGVVYIDEKRMDMAITHLQQCIEQEPNGTYGKRAERLIAKLKSKKKPPMPSGSTR